MSQQSSPLKVLSMAGDAVSKELVGTPVTSLGCTAMCFAPVWVLEAWGDDWGCPGEPGRGVLGRGCSVPLLLPEGLGEGTVVPVVGLLGGSVPVHPLSGREGPPVPARQWGKVNESTRWTELPTQHPPPPPVVPLPVLCLQ